MPPKDALSAGSRFLVQTMSDSCSELSGVRCGSPSPHSVAAEDSSHDTSEGAPATNMVFILSVKAVQPSTDCVFACEYLLVVSRT